MSWSLRGPIEGGSGHTDMPSSSIPPHQGHTAACQELEHPLRLQVSSSLCLHIYLLYSLHPDEDPISSFKNISYRFSSRSHSQPWPGLFQTSHLNFSEGICSLFVFLCCLLNLLGWHWLMKWCRFQGYNSIVHHLYIALCVYHPGKCPFKHIAGLVLKWRVGDSEIWGVGANKTRKPWPCVLG